MFKLVSLLAIGLASPALAAETPSAAIRIGDLDLATPAGLAAFDARVRAAAGRMCGAPPPMDHPTFWAVTDCQSAVRRSADAGVAKLLARRGLSDTLWARR
ncbi:UrcA family protein [Sphingosinicella sp. BN140058]|uniref:UrcA family protein n=1 Tax=Sphingosinicella sp. BN140058 TaxID=1892855 RepID=UPI0010118884|nr:UrcA family protein [Sphingosinicella sp. BN140058]QAY78331.1 UrcA family protein [Sphingosinicella sp. BN140058]